jgi:hypothetical protein
MPFTDFFNRATWLALALAIGLHFGSADALAQNVLWSENFDSLVLGPNVNEAIVDATAFTHDPPTDWSITNGAELEASTGGVEEWRGWSFADPGFWSQVDAQRRSEFTRGQNVIAVADSDEFDDIDQVPDSVPYETFLTTPTISLTGSNSSTLAGPETEILRFESSSASPNFKDDNSTNDSLTVFFDKPAGATSVQLEFGYFNSQNNWWWAIDNLQLLDGDPSLRAVRPDYALQSHGPGPRHQGLFHRVAGRRARPDWMELGRRQLRLGRRRLD